MIVYYSVEGETEEHYMLDVVKEIAENFPRMVAEQAAEDYHDNHDGWEDGWPVKINLHDPFKELIASFDVDLESAPIFSATPTE